MRNLKSRQISTPVGFNIFDYTDEKTIKSKLYPEEKILWAGNPNQEILFRKVLPELLISGLVLLPANFYIGYKLLTGKVGDHSPTVLVFLGFLIVGSLFVGHYLLIFGEFYIITSKRIMIIQSVGPINFFQEWQRSHLRLENLSAKRRTFNTGDLLFMKELEGTSYEMEFCLKCIDNYDKVQSFLRVWITNDSVWC